MIKITMWLLRLVRIIYSCPNCGSAWTGGCPNPEEKTWCIICGEGPRGWVWTNFINKHLVGERIAAFREGTKHVH